jgi:deoxyribose-phosphate aldolase
VDRFDELFGQYDLNNLSDKIVLKEVSKIISENLEKNRNKDIYGKIVSFLDITSLNTEDTLEKITGMVEKLNEFDDYFEIISHPAALCVYPCFISVVKDSLRENIDIAAVAGGFPHSQTFIEVKVAEVAMAVMEGATEIDVVIPVGLFLSGNVDEVYSELSEMKASCRKAKMKVILETGLLKDAEAIKKAAIVSMVAGADFIKTSTGKIPFGATPEAVYVMCTAVKEFYQKNGMKIGIKVAGNIVDTEDALKYYTIVENVLGEEWLTPAYFRIGASRLANNLLSDILEEEVKYF